MIKYFVLVGLVLVLIGLGQELHRQHRLRALRGVLGVHFWPYILTDEEMQRIYRGESVPFDPARNPTWNPKW